MIVASTAWIDVAKAGSMNPAPAAMRSRNPRQNARKCTPRGGPKGDWRSVVAAVVAPHEPVMPTCRDVFLPEATGAPAKLRVLITMQMFEVQLDQP